MAQKQTTQKKHLIFWLADKEKSLINFVNKNLQKLNKDYIKGTALMLIFATLFYFSMWIFY